jgi:polyhydroxyalkanoate synthesis repressor PhaR
MRLIKRYKNRRLYDTEASRTITQADLAGLIQDGAEVQVIDSASGQDITLEVLSRVAVSEPVVRGNIQEAREFFRNVIILGGDTSMSILKNTVLASIGAFQVTKKKAEEIIDDLIKKGDLDKSKRTDAVMELLDKAEKSTESFRKKVLAEAEKAQTGMSKFAKEIAWARQTDMQKLEAKVNKLAKEIKALKDELAGK